MVVQDVPPFCLVQGDRARLAGLNTVGLKRAGFSVAEVSALRRAYRGLFLGDGPMTERIAVLQPGAGAVAELIQFLAGSDRGVISTPRRARAA